MRMRYEYNFRGSVKQNGVRVEWSLLGAIGIHCAYYFTYIPYNYQ